LFSNLSNPATCLGKRKKGKGEREKIQQHNGEENMISSSLPYPQGREGGGGEKEREEKTASDHVDTPGSPPL